MFVRQGSIFLEQEFAVPSFLKEFFNLKVLACVASRADSYYFYLVVAEWQKIGYGLAGSPLAWLCY